MLNLSRGAVIGLAILAQSLAAEPIVTIDKGYITYHGTTEGSIEQFHNIKYAHDTSGRRRFSPPEPYVPSEGSVLDATVPGPACPQLQAPNPPVFAETPLISEDCLNLRIARPTGTSAGDKLPVVVHIYTGGLVRGNAEDPHWDPTNLLVLSESIGKPVIYVALNFRLNIFGYANLPPLKDRRSLNVGMRDQRVGLQWVKDNIAAFGGDPSKITAFGLSAGGTMTSLQLVAYGGERELPFTQAWSMSGPPGTALNITSDATEIHTRAGSTYGGLDGAAMSYAATNHPPNGLFTFIPVVDGDIIPDRQSVLYKSGKFSKGVPLVYGWTQDDGATNAGPAQAFQDEESIKTAIRNFAHLLTEEDFTQLFSVYPASDFKQDVANYEAVQGAADPIAPIHWFRASRILRDVLFTCSSIDFGFEMSKQSKAQDDTFQGVYLYNLNQSMLTPLFKAMGMPYIGACHGSDYNYISNGVFLEGKVSEEDKKLSESVAASFIHFAYTGNPANPNDEGFKAWSEAFGEDVDKSPSSLKLQLIGGPLGSGPSKVSVDAQQFGEGSMQVPLGMDHVEYGQMNKAPQETRDYELNRQRLFERCAIINSLSEKFDV
ncbi:Alpha/Beta hydrolase protein [Coniella lustricola]|uniref:Alpha/Beta hydrolase protein n=1 Tax=Coniella lustricola TaxID=2025994 RepID=A0A2T3AFK3_9PEZI|nr:Alpha/Beta hydrolase protein [Coniella lustricola]